MHTVSFRHLWRNNRGVAAIEAALLLPVFAFLVVAGLELYLHFRVKAVVEHVSYSVANSIAGQKELYSSGNSGACTTANDICVYNTLASDLFRPLNFQQNGRLRISSYVFRDGSWTIANGEGWQRDYGNNAVTASALGTLQSLPTGATEGETVLVVEALYRNTPFAISANFWDSLGGTSVLYSRSVLRPRHLELRTLLSANG